MNKAQLEKRQKIANTYTVIFHQLQVRAVRNLKILLESLPETGTKKPITTKMVNVRPFSIRITPARISKRKKGTLRRLAVSEWGKFKTRKKKEGMKKNNRDYKICL